MRCIWNECEDVLAACAGSKIPQLYALPQDVVMAPDPQELPRCRKSWLEQNNYPGSCIRVSEKPTSETVR
jgi:hypothetical protein